MDLLGLLDIYILDDDRRSNIHIIIVDEDQQKDDSDPDHLDLNLSPF